MRSIATAIASSVAILTSPWQGQAQEVVGLWDVTWAQAVRYDGDEMEIQRWGDATLELHGNGDEVTGTWTTSIVETVRWSLSGTWTGDLLTLTATERDSDNPELAVVEEMRWRARLTPEGLVGDMTMVLRGRARDLRWRPWNARKPDS